MSDRAIVLEANILIRAVLGKRVRELIVDNANSVQFFSPDVAYVDARKYLPSLLKKRGIDSESATAVLNAIETIVRPLELGVYADFKTQALERIATRDADDWPVLACDRLPCVDGRRGLFWRRGCHVDFGSGGALLGWLIAYP